jgi:predicted hydrocarbon binding protein
MLEVVVLVVQLVMAEKEELDQTVRPVVLVAAEEMGDYLEEMPLVINLKVLLRLVPVVMAMATVYL